MHAQLRACNACRSVHNCISHMGFEMPSHNSRYATLRALLSICVVWDLQMKHIDFKCAFLNGVLQQEVYIV